MCKSSVGMAGHKSKSYSDFRYTVIRRWSSRASNMKDSAEFWVQVRVFINSFWLPSRVLVVNTLTSFCASFVAHVLDCVCLLTTARGCPAWRCFCSQYFIERARMDSTEKRTTLKPKAKCCIRNKTLKIVVYGIKRLRPHLLYTKQNTKNSCIRNKKVETTSDVPFSRQSKEQGRRITEDTSSKRPEN